MQSYKAHTRATNYVHIVLVMPGSSPIVQPTCTISSTGVSINSSRSIDIKSSSMNGDLLILAFDTNIIVQVFIERVFAVHKA